MPAPFYMHSLYKLSTPSIPENMTFDRFKALLVQINPYYPQSAITLNLPLSSVIRTPKEKEQFREKVKQFLPFYINGPKPPDPGCVDNPDPGR